MKSIFLIFILSVGLILTSSNTKHEYYVSVTNIEHAKEQQSVQIISQVFIDDFERLIRERYDETITLAQDDEPELVDVYMKRYLEDKLKISINGKAYKFNFIGKEYKEDITYCYLEIENIKDIKSIKVVNRLLFDILPEQQNIVRLKLNDRNKSFLLIPENDECMLNFN
ncbi:MAG: peptidase E [Winogradskyella sp.]|nr:peptidase E [Winogradskyella sp.]|tara:strand:- start:27 stop:533 length:507 start_codon:yes stop_codon:yes gene_type:complete